MKVCDTRIENNVEVTHCTEVQFTPTFDDEMRDTTILFVFTCFLAVFIVKTVQRLFLGE